ncbi:MAG: hypothetical protein JWQ27_1891 [Ferruginibacter sp.]|nr:hypothetical protein [Ferruginibacter sp.]
MRRPVLAHLLLLMFACECYAQPLSQPLLFNHLNVNNGLSQGVNNCIYKDSRGFIWISSFDGLNRFDGLHCKIFRENSSDSGSVKGTLFLNILEDQRADLWIGSNQGLNRYDRKLGRFTQFIVPGRTMVDQFLSPFYIDNQGNIWLQSRSEIFCLQPSTGKFALIKNFHQPGNLIVRTAAMKPFQQLTKIYAVLNNASAFYIISLSGLVANTEQIGISNPTLTNIRDFIPAGNNILLGAAEGLFRFKPVSKENEMLAADDGLKNISALRIDERGRLWVGTLQSGLYLIDTSKKTVAGRYNYNKNESAGLSGPQVTYIYSDDQQYLWTGIWGKGIDFTNLEKFRFNYFLSKENVAGKTADNFIRSIVETDQQEIWAATQSGGILVLDKNKQVINTITKPLPASIEHLFKDREGNVWAATFSGLYQFDPRTKRVRTIKNITSKSTAQNQFNFIYQLHDGQMLASSNAGLFIGRNNAGVISFKELKTNAGPDVFLTTFQDKQGRLYISRAFKGFFVARLSGDSLLKEKDFSYQATIKSFAEISPGELWIGSTIGLIKYDKEAQKVKKIFTTNDGLANQYIYAAIPYRDEVWLSSNAGLARLNMHSEEISNYTVADGLQSNEFNTYAFCQTREGELLFGGVNGLNSFFPGKVTAYKNLPMLQLAGMQVNDSTFKPAVDPGELADIKLGYDQNTVSFRFTVIDYSNPSAARLKYHLEGYDKNDIYADNSSVIRYANLPPGNYSLYVRAINAAGLMSAQEKIILLHIARPWWLQWWFTLLIVLISSAMLFLVIRSYLHRRLQRQRIALEKQQAIEKERTRIATDMHDDFGASLSRIKFLSEKMQLDDHEEVKWKTDLAKISGYSDEMAEKMGEIVWALNQRHDTLGHLAGFCRSYATDYLLDKNISLQFRTEQTHDIYINGEIRRNVFLVIKEALHNTVKHAHASAVTISMVFEEGLLKVDIGDNGVGINMGTIRPFANGLENMKKRMHDVDGKIFFSNNAGSHIRLELPCC